MRKHALIVTLPAENPKSKAKKIFSISTRRLAESVEGLNSALAQSAGSIGLGFQTLQNKRHTRDLK